MWGAADFTDVHISDSFTSFALLLLVAMILAFIALLNTYRLLAGNTLPLPVKKTTALQTITLPSQIFTRDTFSLSEKMSETLGAKCLISDCRATTA